MYRIDRQRTSRIHLNRQIAHQLVAKLSKKENVLMENPLNCLGKNWNNLSPLINFDEQSNRHSQRIHKIVTF